MSRRQRTISAALHALMAAALMACASPAEKAAATSEWGDCVMRAVARLDDGKSDPASIAYGISPQCSVYYARLTDIIAAENITQGGELAARARARAGEVRLITSAVLTYRAARRPQ